MKKLTALLLALLMGLSLTACGGKTPSADPASPSNTQTAPADGTSGSVSADLPEDAPASWLCAEKTTLRVLTFDTEANTIMPVSNDLEFWKFVEEYTNVHIEWDSVPLASYSEVLQSRMASGEELGDIVLQTGNPVNTFSTGGMNGLFVDLAPYWDSCFAQTKKYIAENQIDYMPFIQNPDGSIYSIVGVTNAEINHLMPIWKTSWLEQLGAEVPATLDEFRDLLYKMKDAGDLNGDGKDNEVILTSCDIGTLMNPLYNAFGLENTNYYADDAGLVHATAVSENYRAMLSMLHGLYADGILDPELFTMSWDMLSERASTERVGVFNLWSSFAPAYGRLTQAGIADPLSENYTLSVALKSEYNNNEPFIMRQGSATGGAAVTTNCASPELAMRWLDALLSDPAIMEFRCWGAEGEDYTVTAGGEKELIMPADGSSWNINHRGCGQVVTPHFQTNDQLNNPDAAYGWYLDEYAAYSASGAWKSYSVPQTSACSAEEQDIIDTYQTDVNTYVDEMRDKFIKGESSLETDWDTYCKNLEALGLNEMIKAHQSIYDRFN